MAAILQNVTSFVTAAIGWVGSFVTLISQQEILLLSCVCIPVAGFGIGALHRLTRIRT